MENEIKFNENSIKTRSLVVHTRIKSYGSDRSMKIIKQTLLLFGEWIFLILLLSRLQRNKSEDKKFKIHKSIIYETMPLQS